MINHFRRLLTTAPSDAVISINPTVQVHSGMPRVSTREGMTYEEELAAQRAELGARWLGNKRALRLGK